MRLASIRRRRHSARMATVTCSMPLLRCQIPNAIHYRGSTRPDWGIHTVHIDAARKMHLRWHVWILVTTVNPEAVNTSIMTRMSEDRADPVCEENVICLLESIRNAHIAMAFFTVSRSSSNLKLRGTSARSNTTTSVFDTTKQQ
ncbi:hypothetical protein PsorP6_006796 [Peronosclerospora sorghi]|uniref:Uncharacterized protein n=1 Tax=Peronosclerospora sorghi TaxID=230839 RepID=A0ACC0W593_9STRA|nr:hypothetical protein PsorP6_006796 [Peronosclerospora sorghi]